MSERKKRLDGYVAAREHLAELEATFDLRWRADMRAIKTWQAAHPGKDLTWPDHADLVVWLVGENERLRKTTEVARAFLLMDDAEGRNRTALRAALGEATP